MAGAKDDELAQTALAPSEKPAVDLGRTATAPESGSKPATPAEPIGKTLGRYRLERELGAGGMGVVHAAFDPDLERRVALKVLLHVDGDAAHKERLQREARAMARLAHPNVVTVHEVGTVNGRDYVAMELIDGESLAEWLRSTKRPESEIIDAFLAAGRGLAAAHAAGMVHRDFKPHNVLRAKSGRIAVTDFGLAREASADVFASTHAAGPRAKTSKVVKPKSGDQTPSTPLAGLTMTGAVLGTPAYMAPEQWAGANVTPATDQFAFCVALWEALSGERPFRADTAEMLRRAVELGPAPLDDSKIPRRLRPVLRRGLDPVQSKRWPSMDALLAEMAPPKRPPLALIGGGVAVVGAAAIYVLATRSPPTPPTPPVAACPAPAIDPAKIELSGNPLETKMIAADLDRWKVAREKACALEPAKRGSHVTCLDRVMSRLDAVAKAVAKLPKTAKPADAGRELIDPSVCEKSPPRLEPVSPGLADVMALAISIKASDEPIDAAKVMALLERVGKEPCAAAWANLVAWHIPDRAGREKYLTEAEQQAERCGDDRLRADVAIHVAAVSLERVVFGLPKTAKLKLAAAAVERVEQADLVADVEQLRSLYAFRAENIEEAIVRGEAAMAGYAMRGRIAKQLDAGLDVNDMRELRGEPKDLVRVRDLRAGWLETARKELGPGHPMTRKLERAVAWAKFQDGDVATAQTQLVQLLETQPLDRKRRMQVKVVDAAGKPVVGAKVSAGSSMIGAGTLAAFPMPGMESTLRTGTTTDSGEVTFEVALDGMVIAQHGELRSRPALIADTVTLALEPTSRLEGKVDTRDVPTSRVLLAVHDTRNGATLSRYEMIAPVNPDGTFVFEGVPRAKLQVFTALRTGSSRSVTAHDVVVTEPVMKGIKLAVPGSQRTVQVIVRSTVDAANGGAQVFVLPNAVKSTSLEKFRFDGNTAIKMAKPADEKAPAAIKALLKPNDMLAALNAPPKGVATACAIGLPLEVDDPDLDRKIRDNLKKIEVRCSPIAEGAESVVVEVPPWPRLE